ncbi:MAG TPA: RidA family protein [Alphaproteobacteria bacterium]|jgi:enamine deaminase RidA (YjgF/YER057c/UK114 family)|nr:RidA family protein [Alphaproteobacteria bacterium]MDP6271189.1 RidA family protein [Alphaproteobacteria bacterium]HJM50578.1 RidA family protein [Alphaproteobacteria bacterium]
MSQQRTLISSGSKYEELAGYSRAVAQGEWILVSGTVGYNFKTGSLPEGAREQAEQAFVTIREALEKAGSSLMDVVRARVYIPDPDDVVAVSEVVKAHLGEAKPANTTVCAPLAVPECKVEIEVTAMRQG